MDEDISIIQLENIFFNFNFKYEISRTNIINQFEFIKIKNRIMNLKI